ncbi:MAG TPA: GGDEF domain-containing protein [Kofleriaceae bacterium]|nr:GGDEF domain-containing protein [Kofleriaceae bacterium]
MTDWDDTTHVSRPPHEAAPRSNEERAYIVVLAGSNVGEMYKISDQDIVLGRGAGADIRLVDEGISRFHCRIRAKVDHLVVEDLQSRNGTFLNGQRIDLRQLEDGDKIQIGRTTVLKFSFHDQIEESFQRKMFDSALRDGLTRAYNKRFFLDRLHSEVRFALRHQSPLGLLLLDIDHFKRVNDQWGHLAGDRVLGEFAGLIMESVRDEDVFARYGGEEFAVLSRLISAGDCARFAERLRRSVEQLKAEYDGTIIPITVSIGVASVPVLRVQTANDLLRAADRALYQAKQAGRNRVVSCRPDMLEDLPGTATLMAGEATTDTSRAK